MVQPATPLFLQNLTTFCVQFWRILYRYVLSWSRESLISAAPFYRLTSVTQNPSKLFTDSLLLLRGGAKLLRQFRGTFIIISSYLSIVALVFRLFVFLSLLWLVPSVFKCYLKTKPEQAEFVDFFFCFHVLKIFSAC